MRAVLTLLLALAIWQPPMVRELTGGVQVYEVARGDTLTSIGARFGIDGRTLARDNGVSAAAAIQAGDRLTLDNRHIAPAPPAAADAIVINVAQRMLFVFHQGRVARALPVAVGRRDWKTPLGMFAIAVKEVDPVWDVPVSIQQEMERNRQPVLTQVRPGPGNPLGNRWLGLTAPGVGIHGTNQPASIYRFATHGCIRVHPDDMLELFDDAEVGMPVELVYEPVLVARVDDAIYAEVHRDAYSRVRSNEDRLNRLLRESGLDRLIGSPAVRRVLADQAGRAVVVEDAITSTAAIVQR